MENNEILTLENGLKLVLYQDNTKHTTEADLIIKFGGSNKKLKVNDATITIPNGIAHFLEHILLEHSKYGNLLTRFNEKNIRTNGITSNDYTAYYIDTVKDFEESLIELITAVNTKHFTVEDVKTTKKAIIKERMMDEDNKKRKLQKKMYECIFKNIEYPNTLGEIEDIENIDYEILSKIYDLTYQFNNQTLIISGNFNKEKIIKIIKETYTTIKKEYIKCELLKPVEPNEVNNKYGIIYDDIHTKYITLSYKVSINHLTQYEKLQLDFMIYWFLLYNFDSSSHIYNNFVKKNICNNTITCSTDIVNGFLLIDIGTYIIDNDEEFIKTIEETIKNKIIDENDFNLRKKESIISLILREDSLNAKVSPFINNILTFNCDHMDSIEDIENITFDKYKETINNLDFSNYSIIKVEKETDK